MPEVVDVLRFQDEISNQTSLLNVPGECALNTTTIDIVCGMGVARRVGRVCEEGLGGHGKKGGEGVARRVRWVCAGGWRRVCEEGWGGCVKKSGGGCVKKDGEGV